jgi:cadmium resistance protein CadD (predicted permease)
LGKSFYKSIFRRKIIIWFFVAVAVQNYWLSAPYGRNWRYLWTTQHAPAWLIGILVVAFFVVIWAIFLVILSLLSKSHSWILPVFAIGLGAPRWCQLLWGTVSIDLFLSDNVSRVETLQIVLEAHSNLLILFTFKMLKVSILTENWCSPGLANISHGPDLPSHLQSLDGVYGFGWEFWMLCRAWVLG